MSVMLSTPKVTIVITTKNRIALLPRSIRSVLEQTWTNWELIVVDDGSDILVELPIADVRVRLIRHDVSKGLSEARNAGFRSATGEFFCMLDDDDWYLPEKLDKQVNFLLSQPDIDMVFSRVVVRDAEGKCRYYLSEDHVFSPEINLRAFNVIHPSSVLFRRAVFNKVQFEPRIKKYEDTLFFNRICFTFNTAYLPIDVAVWMQDGRPDQLTRVFYDRNFLNFRIVCQELHDILMRYPKARRQYYARLAFQALRCRRLRDFFRAGSRFLRDHATSV